MWEIYSQKLTPKMNELTCIEIFALNQTLALLVTLYANAKHLCQRTYAQLFTFSSCLWNNEFEMILFVLPYHMDCIFKDK